MDERGLPPGEPLIVCAAMSSYIESARILAKSLLFSSHGLVPARVLKIDGALVKQLLRTSPKMPKATGCFDQVKYLHSSLPPAVCGETCWIAHQKARLRLSNRSLDLFKP